MAITAATSRVPIRTYRPGDETAQVEIYNTATAGLPGFKPATAEEIARRYRAVDFDPESKLYAERDGRVVGYVSFSPNGRMSVPWCLPAAAEIGDILVEAALRAMQERGLKRAWAAYRADWTEIGRQLEAHGFEVAHEIINFVAPITTLPRQPRPLQGPFAPHPLQRHDTRQVFRLDPTAFGVPSAEALDAAWWESPYLSHDFFINLTQLGPPEIVAAGIAVTSLQYADPTKIDPAMPCFRLGAIGTEAERTKRVNGLFSYVARPDADNHKMARLLLEEACFRFERTGVTHVASQCRSDRPVELAFYDSYFQRQKAFAVYARNL